MKIGIGCYITFTALDNFIMCPPILKKLEKMKTAKNNWYIHIGYLIFVYSIYVCFTDFLPSPKEFEDLEYKMKGIGKYQLV